MKALFVCNASPSIGIGHVMRCLTLADALHKKGWRCSFLCTEETLKTASALKNSPYNLLHSQGDIQDIYDTIIIDDYEINEEREQQFRPLGKNITVIDDLANRMHDCDILIDQTLGRLTDDYKKLTPNECKILTGASYTLLRPEFLNLRISALSHRQKTAGAIKNILISLGGTDHHNVTSTILNSLTFIKANILINVVLNKKSDFKEDIKKKCTDLKNKGVNIHLKFDVTDMANLMSQADIAIGAAGTSSWERCCLGLPTIMLETADNQKHIGAALHKKFAADNLGVFSSLSSQDITSKLKFYLDTPNKLQEMSENASKIVDGKGISRVITYLIGESKNGTSLRVMNKTDIKTLFEWQNHKKTRQYSRNNASPSWDEHKKWFSNIMSDTSRDLYMIRHNNKNVGMLRLDPKEPTTSTVNSYEISILIDPNSYGKGLAKSALKLIRKIEPKTEIWAEILPQNKASISLFETVGYQRINKTWFMESSNERV